MTWHLVPPGSQARIAWSDNMAEKIPNSKFQGNARKKVKLRTNSIKCDFI
jgi:hypothetical protein